jgi:hypothetical protein
MQPDDTLSRYFFLVKPMPLDGVGCTLFGLRASNSSTWKTPENVIYILHRLSDCTILAPL